MSMPHAISSRRRQRGQGMTEYVIIVALVAIATIAVVSVFGNNIRALFGSASNALMGQESAPTELGGQQVESMAGRTLEDFYKKDAP